MQCVPVGLDEPGSKFYIVINKDQNLAARARDTKIASGGQGGWRDHEMLKLPRSQLGSPIRRIEERRDILFDDDDFRILRKLLEY